MQRGRCLFLSSCGCCMTLSLLHVGKFLTFAKPWSTQGSLQTRSRKYIKHTNHLKTISRTKLLIASHEPWEKDAWCPEDHPCVFVQRKPACFTMCGTIGRFLEFHIRWVQKLVIWDLVLDQVENIRTQASSWIELMQPLLTLLVLLYLGAWQGYLCQCS